MCIGRAQVEPSVLRRLFLGRQKYLLSVAPDSEPVERLKTAIRADLQRACLPLREYLSQVRGRCSVFVAI